MTMEDLAEAVGIGERTLRSIERDERPGARTIGLVEAYLGLDKEMPQRSPSPPLDEATDAELAVEIFKRLERSRAAGPEVEALPESDPGLVLGPADEPEQSPKQSGDDR